jgi:hypothetical protein
MNGSAENKAHGASKRPERNPINLKLETAERMLPLVQRIVEDIVVNHHEVAILVPEQVRLDRQKRDLTWPERQRRYRVGDDISARERLIEESLAELTHLGLMLVDAASGQVGFPTQVNNRRAFFSWRRGEAAVNFWHFADEENRRPIPASWMKGTASALSANG